MKAWEFLGLKGSQDEISRGCDGVDTDGSGKISQTEFVTAIRESRSTELSLTVLLSQMDGHLEGMDGFFEKYKRSLEQAKANALANQANAEERFKKFQATSVTI